MAHADSDTNRPPSTGRDGWTADSRCSRTQDPQHAFANISCDGGILAFAKNRQLFRERRHTKKTIAMKEKKSKIGDTRLSNIKQWTNMDLKSIPRG